VAIAHNQTQTQDWQQWSINADMIGCAAASCV
jgi:hypothetical protein